MAASSSIINTEPIDERVSLRGREITAASDIYSLSSQREIEIEARAFAGMALHPNLARVFLNNSITHRQAEAGSARLSFPQCFSGEEGVVDAMDVLLRNPCAGVG